MKLIDKDRLDTELGALQKTLSEEEDLVMEEVINIVDTCPIINIKSPEPKLIPEAFHPSKYIREEMQARGLTLKQLAAHLNIRYSLLRDTLLPNCVITPGLANKLGEFFGTGAEVWLNLQARYDLTKMIQKRKEKN